MRSRVDTGMVKDSGALHSGAIAKATGVSPDTIRHYERIGILRSSRTQSGYRVYSENTVERVLVVQRALRIGFTLAELADVLKTRDEGGVPCHHVYKMATEKLKGITADIKAMKQTQRYLKQLVDEWGPRLQKTAPGQKSNLLHSLTGSVKGSKTKRQFGRTS
jgi:DNA-binding transcriptional MerR regulator